MLQKTIATSAEIKGRGIHSGNVVHVRLKPGAENSGIVFMRDGAAIHACVQNVRPFERATCLQQGALRVYTVEHLLGALQITGITNVRIEVNGEELPFLDGSAKPWCDLIRSAGIYGQNAFTKSLVVTKEVIYQNATTGGKIHFVPDRTSVFSHTVLFESKTLQTAECDAMDFETDVAPARSYCFSSDLKKLRNAGLLGGLDTLSGFVVLVGPDLREVNELFGFDADRYVHEASPYAILSTEAARFSDEMARHKILDMIGDFSLSGCNIRGRIHAVGTGHAENHAALGLLMATPGACQVSTQS